MSEYELIDLDECVLNALVLFQKPLPALDTAQFKRPLIVGSGNAAATGKILFDNADAVFADEGTYQHKLDTVKEIDAAVLLSASGGKHAPIIAKELNKRGIRTLLLTNNNNAPAKEFVDNVMVFPKNPEPYTYNTSTYMGMILSKTKEDPAKILSFIKAKIDPLIPTNFNQFDSYYILLPQKFDLIREFFLTKFDELFGARISGRVYTPEQTKHAKTVVPSDKEFFISIGYENKEFGKSRLNIPLPENANYAAALAIGYYIIGKIQQQNPPYFKDNIAGYAQNASKMFGETIKPLVD